MVSADGGTIAVESFTPGRDWTADTEQWLVDGLTTTLPDLRLSALFAARRDMFREAHVITAATDTRTGTAVGALSSRWCALPSGRPFLHILTQFVGTEYQHGAVFRRSWRDHFTALGTVPELITLKTYNPVVYCAMHAFTRVPGVSLYPDVSPADGQDPAMADLAAQLAATVSAGHVFVPETGVIRGVGVPRDLYRRMPLSSREAANSYFGATTQPGDRILCVLCLPGVRAREQIRAVFGADVSVTESAAPQGIGERR